MTNSTTLPHPTAQDNTAAEYVHHSSGQRVFTDTVIIDSLRKQYPELKLTVVPQGGCNLLRYAAAGHADATPIVDPNDPDSASFKWRQYIPPARRFDDQRGVLVDLTLFGKYLYSWRGHEFVLYVVSGMMPYPNMTNNYILSKMENFADELITAASRYALDLHDEVWVYDQGYWQKSAELWNSVQQSEWENVILDPLKKEAIISDVNNFFENRTTYEKLRVPWKRGIIFYGPPGNGKTISIKATMHSLYDRQDPIPTLYVRSLASFAGPEYSISTIFAKARQDAPCYLVFEDLDSIVSDTVRSYFLNEVDGLTNNDGILMIGSTNHLERLDPGISKRPSRFDRKYFFPNPDRAGRVEYAKLWQRKLSDNEDLEFPDRLCEAIADITNQFSFAYMQEAFVAALLVIASRDNHTPQGLRTLWSSAAEDLSVLHVDDDDDLNDLILWREIKKQVKLLRDELKGKNLI